jgi:three-Cys-motif partner protein
MDDYRLFERDELITPKVGEWAITKHSKLEYYDTLFAKSMHNKWDCRVYLDLFSCAGKSELNKSHKVVPGSPLIALSVQDPFDKYIFAEENPEYMQALQKRISRYFPSADCEFLLGNCNERIDDIISLIPKFSKEYRGLTLCFIDPFKSGQLNFKTIQLIATSIYVDFLVLIPSYMDINRNEHNYCRVSDDSLNKFLGNTKWHKKWENKETHYNTFGIFIADEFGNSMKELGFIYNDTSDMVLVRMEYGQNLPLYHLAFFSRNKLGVKFWRETIRRTDDQLSFMWDEE